MDNCASMTILMLTLRHLENKEITMALSFGILTQDFRFNKRQQSKKKKQRN